MCLTCWALGHTASVHFLYICIGSNFFGSQCVRLHYKVMTSYLIVNIGCAKHPVITHLRNNFHNYKRLLKVYYYKVTSSFDFPQGKGEKQSHTMN